MLTHPKLHHQGFFCGLDEGALSLELSPLGEVLTSLKNTSPGLPKCRKSATFSAIFRQPPVGVIRGFCVSNVVLYNNQKQASGTK